MLQKRFNEYNKQCSALQILEGHKNNASKEKNGKTQNKEGKPYLIPEVSLASLFHLPL